MQINHDSETSRKKIICYTEVEVITWKIVVSNVKVKYKLEINKLKDLTIYFTMWLRWHIDLTTYDRILITLKKNVQKL